MNLAEHAAGAPDSGFVATSDSYQIAYAFAGKNGYVYQICTKRGIDVNGVLGPKSPYPEQKEVAIPGGVSSSEVMSAVAKSAGMIPAATQYNPNFKCDCQ
jgi:hypothetical protein